MNTAKKLNPLPHTEVNGLLNMHFRDVIDLWETKQKLFEAADLFNHGRTIGKYSPTTHMVVDKLFTLLLNHMERLRKNSPRDYLYYMTQGDVLPVDTCPQQISTMMGSLVGNKSVVARHLKILGAHRPASAPKPVFQVIKRTIQTSRVKLTKINEDGTKTTVIQAAANGRGECIYFLSKDIFVYKARIISTPISLLKTAENAPKIQFSQLPDNQFFNASKTSNDRQPHKGNNTKNYLDNKCGETPHTDKGSPTADNFLSALPVGKKMESGNEEGSNDPAADFLTLGEVNKKNIFPPADFSPPPPPPPSPVAPPVFDVEQPTENTVPAPQPSQKTAAQAPDAASPSPAQPKSLQNPNNIPGAQRVKPDNIRHIGQVFGGNGAKLVTSEEFKKLAAENKAAKQKAIRIYDNQIDGLIPGGELDKYGGFLWAQARQQLFSHLSDYRLDGIEDYCRRYMNLHIRRLQNSMQIDIPTAYRLVTLAISKHAKAMAKKPDSYIYAPATYLDPYSKYKYGVLTFFIDEWVIKDEWKRLQGVIGDNKSRQKNAYAHNFGWKVYNDFLTDIEKSGFMAVAARLQRGHYTTRIENWCKKNGIGEKAMQGIKSTFANNSQSVLRDLQRRKESNGGIIAGLKRLHKTK